MKKLIFQVPDSILGVIKALRIFAVTLMVAAVLIIFSDYDELLKLKSMLFQALVLVFSGLVLLFISNWLKGRTY